MNELFLGLNFLVCGAILTDSYSWFKHKKWVFTTKQLAILFAFQTASVIALLML